MEQIKLKQVAQLTDKCYNEMTGRVYSDSGLSPAIRAMGGGGLEPKIMEEPIIYDDYNGRIKADQRAIGPLTCNCGNDADRNGVKIIEPMTTRGGGIMSTLRATIHKQGERNLMENLLNGRGYEGVIEPIALDEQNRCIRQDGTAGTLTTDGSSPKHNNRVIEPTIWGSKQEHCARRKDGICPTLTEAMGMGGGQIPLHNYNYRIRKLTPKECWRLMNFDDEDFYRAAYGREVPVELAKRVEKRNLKKDEWKVLWRYMRHQQVSNSQLYRQAGNSIVVSVLEAIFKQML